MNNFLITRIGKERDEFNRIVKIALESIEDRDEFLKNTRKLKHSPGIWKKVYIHKERSTPSLCNRE